MLAIEALSHVKLARQASVMSKYYLSALIVILGHANDTPSYPTVNDDRYIRTKPYSITSDLQSLRGC